MQCPAMKCELTEEANGRYFRLVMDWLRGASAIEAGLVDVVVSSVWRPRVSVLVDLRGSGQITMSPEEIEHLVRVHKSIEGLMGGITSGPRYALLAEPGSAFEVACEFRERARGVLHAEVAVFLDEGAARTWVSELFIADSGEFRLGPPPSERRPAAGNLARVIPFRAKGTG
jgi:hypothetical protein